MGVHIALVHVLSSPFCDFVAQIYKKTEINGIEFKRGCFDKIDGKKWIPDWDVNENKRLEIGTALAHSVVFFFFLSFLFLS